MDPLLWAFLLAGVAMLVIACELFIPSAGILGMVATGLIIASIVMAFQAGFQTGAIFLMAALIILPILIFALIKVWPHTPIGRSILLDDISPESLLPPDTFSADLLGQIGIAKTKMLPSGIVVINGTKMDAVSDGFPIDANQPIKITAIKGNRIYVQPFEPANEYPQEQLSEQSLPRRDDELLAKSFEDLELEDDKLR